MTIQLSVLFPRGMSMLVYFLNKNHEIHSLQSDVFITIVETVIVPKGINPFLNVLIASNCC